MPLSVFFAVGVVAYNGYTSSAKINVVKNNFKIAEKLTEAITVCQSGLDFYWADGQNCQNNQLTGIKWHGVYMVTLKNIKTNVYDSAAKAIESVN